LFFEQPSAFSRRGFAPEACYAAPPIQGGGWSAARRYFFVVRRRQFPSSARLTALHRGDFSARAALFVRPADLRRLSVSELLAPALSSRGRGPGPSRVRGCEPRPRAPLPAPPAERLRKAPLASGDARNIIQIWGMWIADHEDVITVLPSVSTCTAFSELGSLRQKLLTLTELVLFWKR